MFKFLFLALFHVGYCRVPNIIFYLADDLGYGEVGLYPSNSQHGRIATPNLDMFGHSALRFAHAYAGYTVCAPSRATLMTGMHAGHIQPPLNSQTANKTLPALLQKAGYHTALVGKWGLGNPGQPGEPLKQGFDMFYGQTDQNDCHNMYPAGVYHDNPSTLLNLTLNYQPKSRELCMANPEKYNYSIDLFHNRAIEYLDARAKDPNTPFFLYYTPTVPHAGGWTFTYAEQGNPVPHDGNYSGKAWPDVEKDHAAVITHVLDHQFGELMQHLKQLGLEDDTIVFFASDNGAHNEGGHSYMFFDSSGPLQGFKRSLYDGGVRSPIMVRWPGVTPVNATSDFAWAFWDILPTVAEIAGIPKSELPANLDGISILDVLKGGSQADHYLYWTWNGGYGIRQGQWKGILKNCSGDLPPPPNGELLLFDILTDVHEDHNVAAAHPDVVEQLMQIPVQTKSTCKEAPNAW